MGDGSFEERAGDEGRLAWRGSVVDGISLGLLLFGAIGLPIIIIQFGAAFTPMGGCTLGLWLMLLATMLLRRHLPLAVRALALVVVFYGAMMVGLAFVGPMFGPALAGAAAVLITGLVFGRRAGLLALAVGAFSIVALGGLVSSSLVHAPPDAIRSMQHMSSWAREAIGYSLFAGLIVLTVGFVVRRNEHALAAVSDALLQMQREEKGRLQAQAALEESQRAVTELQRVESLGRLAGGVAHDFNNALVVLMGGVELLGDADLRTEDTEVLHDMRKALEGCAQLTAQLLAYGRRDRVQPQLLDSGKVLTSVTRSLRRVLPDDVVLHVELDAPPTIFADRSQIEHIVLNLVLNARDAMPAGGEVYMSAESGEGAASVPSFVLIVRDTGPGVPQALREKVFEPFFTTKAVGQGTGLGLSTVYGVVRRLGGDISILDDPRGGAAFRVRLPAHATSHIDDTSSEEDGPSGGANGTVLLVEDDQMTRRMMHTALTQEGYLVLQAEHAIAALLQLDRHPGSIAILCTDGVMPGGRCAELISTFRQRHPQSAVLLCSGHSERELVERGLLVEGVQYLAKPFRRMGLLDRVNALTGD